MSRKRKKTKAEGGAAKTQEADRKQAPRPSGILIGLAAAVALIGIYLAFTRLGPGSGGTDPSSGRPADTESVGSADFQALVGRWVRPDGGYILAVRSVDPAGRVDAGYFNPRPIHVSRAEASLQGKAVRLFVELQAVGYPGSTYELTYDRGSDTLAGIYFQAAMQQRFEVVFFRAKGRDENR